MFSIDLSGLVPIVIALVLIVTLLLAISRMLKWYRRVPPNKVMVIFGGSHGKGTEKRGFRIVKGGGTFVVPIIEEVKELSLDLMTIEVDVVNVYTIAGVPVSVTGVAQVKIGGDDVAINVASEQLLGKTPEQVRDVAHQTLSGHLRAILGGLTVDEIFKDRNAFAQKVAEVAKADMANMGLHVVSFTIKEVRDGQGYLDALGAKRVAEVKRDAQIGQAEAARESTIKVAAAKQAGREAEVASEVGIAAAERDKALKVAEFRASSDTANAKAALAGELQKQISQQEVTAAQAQVELVKTQKMTLVAEQDALRREKGLEAEVKKPADAEAYRLTRIAQAEREAAVTKATGQGEASRVLGEGTAAGERAKGLALAAVQQAQGEAQAAVQRAQGLASADVVKAQGTAEGDAIRAKGLAQAESVSKLAEAQARDGEIGLRQIAIERSFETRTAIGQAVANAMGGIGANMKVIQFADGHGTGGNALISTLMQIPEVVAMLDAKTEALSGQGVAEVLERAAQVVRGTKKEESNKEK